jgi:hypothetical protein
MLEATNKLISIGGEALAESEIPARSVVAPSTQLSSELFDMLRLRNGFFAFEGALHVLPAGPAAVMSLEKWNSRELWRYEYGDLCTGLYFFAEDGFGNQFCLCEAGVCSFDAETGQAELMGPSLEDWAGAVLTDYEFLTGFPLFHEWQSLHGRVPSGSRLLPKVPFVLGGDYSLSNLRSAGAVSAMRSRGNLARQILELPDGGQIEFKIVD